MGDSERPFRGEGDSPAAASQAGMVSNSLISKSHVTIQNIQNSYEVHYHFHCNAEQGEPCTRQQPEEDKEKGGSDEHKELINSLSLSGSHERHVDGSIREPICYSGHYDDIELEEAAALMRELPDEVPKPLLDSQLVRGRPMPADCSCTIAPHSCKVRPSTFLKFTQRLLPTFFKKECVVMVCLVMNMVCISKSTNRNVIQYVVDIAKKPLCLKAHDLTVGSVVITLPESKVSEWKTVIEQSQKVQSLPPASTGEDVEAEGMSIVSEEEELKIPEECGSMDDPSRLLANSLTNAPSLLAVNDGN